MSFKSLQLIAVCIVPIMFSPVVLSEEVVLEKTTQITLASLADKVFQRHPGLNKASALQQKVNANTALSQSRFAAPTSFDLTHFNDVITSQDGFQESESNLTMTLWLPEEKKQQQLLSDNLAAEMPAYNKQLRLEASAKVRELIWAVALAETAAKQALQTWNTAQKLEDDVKTRVNAGELAGTESLLASTHALDMKSQYLMKMAELERTVTIYKQVTGEFVLPLDYEESLFKTQEYQNNAVVSNQHPSLTILDQRINTLRTQQSLAQYNGAVHPNLSVGIRNERGSDTESYNNSIGLGISFAIDNKIYRQPAVANAGIALADAEIARQTLERELTITLVSNLNSLETAQRQLEISKQKNETTKRYLALQQRAFDLGEIDLGSLIRSQTLASESHNTLQLLEIEVKKLIALVNQSQGIILEP